MCSERRILSQFVSIVIFSGGIGRVIERGTELEARQSRQYSLDRSQKSALEYSYKVNNLIMKHTITGHKSLADNLRE